VWRADTNVLHGRLEQNGHRETVTALAFQPASDQLYSASADRTVKLWAVEQLAYIDTVFGHQDAPSAIACPTDASTGERCVTVGGRDRTVRLWKIQEESQLVFRLSETDGGSLDEVVWVSGPAQDPSTPGHYAFVSGADSGLLSLWHAGKKKPVRSEMHCSGHPVLTLTTPSHPSDVVVSGSDDGHVKVWRVHTEPGNHELECINELPVPGCINALAITEDLLVVAVSGEPRNGRWTTRYDLKPTVLVFKRQ
jgi:ribosomal RNA-processing protein 9